MIKSRYGGKTHIIVLVFGLFTNIIVTLSLLLGGTAVLTGLVQVSRPLKTVSYSMHVDYYYKVQNSNRN